ncbi:hypothetical protein KC366_g56 [Hortaea werneckii]|nr:hypothetical protein KC366_g56 [Hortaea werneckii]
MRLLDERLEPSCPVLADIASASTAPEPSSAHMPPRTDWNDVSPTTLRMRSSIARKMKAYVICRVLTIGSTLISISGMVSKQNHIRLLGGAFTRRSMCPERRCREVESTRSTVRVLNLDPKSILATAAMTTRIPPL